MDIKSPNVTPKDIFLAFPEDELVHKSYKSALKNCRNWGVLDLGDEVLFASIKYLSASGISSELYDEVLGTKEIQAYSDQLSMLAQRTRTSFSERKDASWRPHKFFVINLQ